MSIEIEEVYTDPDAARKRIQQCREGCSTKTEYEFYRGEEIHICMEKFQNEFERAMAEACIHAEAEEWGLGQNPADVGYWTTATVEHIDNQGYDITIRGGGHSRTHEVRKSLPKEGITRIMTCQNRCIGKYTCVFVKSEIIRSWYTEGANIIAMLDIAGTKRLLREGETEDGRTRILGKVQAMQEAVHNWSVRQQNMGEDQDRILCMGDSVFIERDQVLGMVSTEEGEARVPTSYEPEKFIREVLCLRGQIQRVTGQKTYCIVTESTAIKIGRREVDESHSRIGDTRILYWPSLGDGIQRALAIEEWAKRAIKQSRHNESEVYLEEYVLGALEFWGQDTRRREHEYWSSGKGTEKYAAFQWANDLIRELDIAADMKRRWRKQYDT